MDLLHNLGVGFSVALSLNNLGFCLIGVLLGTLVGVLPGLGTTATIAILLPLTFQLDSTGSLIMLAGIYYGAQYGGSTTAILVNMPGEGTSVMTAVDGYQMARRGRAGAALATAALASFAAGTLATLVISLFGPLLARAALSFGPPEYFSLMVFGFTMAIVVAAGSLMKAGAMVFLGLLLGAVGTDIETGAERMTFGLIDLYDGVEFAVVAVGLYGIAEILANVATPEKRTVLAGKLSNLWPSHDDFRRGTPAALRGSVIGSILGILPGNGAVLAPFVSYATEKSFSKQKREFGQGAVEGVAGPEAANNAAAQTAFIPMLTLGLPPNAVMAVMIGAMMIQGITPGPQVMTARPDLFWGLIASMWIGNLLLLVINLPLIGIWVQLLRVPFRMLFPSIILICFIGVYSLRNSTFDVLMVGVFGLLGYAMVKLQFERTPFVIAFILGDMMEEKLRQSLLIGQGDVTVFFTRPLSLIMLLASVGLIVLALLPAIRKRRDEAFVDED
ncbi:tripartite tricarboxylate transporter permease [Ancylobacter sp. WKF20]|uniref:tripartite tricarboxylate transporter permease n=1 Tax=Ancylobacter sp. WKF20 TaxID=3039801 RepID=UPI00243456AA|nr:tripartite tricarboxylate transporter permease [Ancylobacter sp. WKF20]WGD29658.1 tripartite tricarboxylate transporter permease [Ancylobacter sp. WKF20]